MTMTNEEFYIDLVSNASMELHQNNTLSSFTNKLPDPLELDGEWEVGLVELFHPISIDADQERNVTFRMICHDSILDPVGHSFTYKTNDNINQLLTNLNETMVDITTSSSQVILKHRNKQVKMTPPKFELVSEKIKFTPGILELFVNERRESQSPFGPLFQDQNFLSVLGIKATEYMSILSEKTVKSLTGKAKPNAKAVSNLLFVYCDIIREHHVGDTMANSLRAIPLTSGADKVISAHTFPAPYYFPTRFRRIESISVLLTDETGTPMKFLNGRTFLTLHFRKRKLI